MSVKRHIAVIGMATSFAIEASVAGSAVASGAVTTAATTMAVKYGVSLNVRSGPGTTYAVKGSVVGGTKLSGYNQGNGWFKINSGAYSGGYVSITYLSPVASPAPVTSPAPAVAGSFSGVVVKTLTKTLVHSAPSTSSSWSQTLSPGSKVSGVVNGDWLKLSSGGYVSRGLISPVPLSNGAIPANRLCGVPTAWNSPGSWAPGYSPTTVRMLDCYALKSLTGLENAYRAQFGRYARIDLAYRPLSEQYYWYNQFGYPRAAMPGTSNHGLGVAVDFRETDTAGEEFGWGGTGYQWLKANAWKWGFRNTFTYGTTGESYHWDFEGVN